MTNSEWVEQHFKRDKHAANIRAWLTKRRPEEVKSFDASMKEIAERQKAFWVEREKEEI